MVTPATSTNAEAELENVYLEEDLPRTYPGWNSD